jgi:integrase/recombinase XerD
LLLKPQERLVFGNPVKASHFARLGRPLPKPLSQEQVQALFTQMRHPLERALFGVMLRGGLRVSEVVKLKRSHIDWEQRAVLIEQGKGRKDRLVYLCTDALEALQACLQVRPKGVPDDTVFWNRKRPLSPLSVNAVQKQMQRLAKAAGIEASCHQLRHTFASTLLENGAELISVKELLGHAKVGTSERYARVSNQRVKQEYQRTMRKVMQTVKV